jgi:hypothetical protein
MTYTFDFESEPSLESASAAADSLRSALPSEIHARVFTLRSAIPFRAAVLKEALAHRASSLADGCISEMRQSRWVNCVVLIRCIIETCALLYCLAQKISTATQAKSDQDLWAFMGRAAVGAKTIDGLPPPLNVLSMIDKVEKEFPGFRNSYDHFSEFAHPNCLGVLVAYADAQSISSTFGLNQEMPPETHAAGLLGILTLVQYAYNLCGRNISELNAAYESGDIPSAA